jgi:hypothetical protein
MVFDGPGAYTFDDFEWVLNSDFLRRQQDIVQVMNIVFKDIKIQDYPYMPFLPESV